METVFVYIYIYNWTIDRKMVRKFISFFRREKVAYFSFLHILCTPCYAHTKRQNSKLIERNTGYIIK